LLGVAIFLISITVGVIADWRELGLANY
jgi:hypothetical protein